MPILRYTTEDDFAEGHDPLLNDPFGYGQPCDQIFEEDLDVLPEDEDFGPVGFDDPDFSEEDFNF